jgi:hypothetical protein
VKFTRPAKKPRVDDTPRDISLDLEDPIEILDDEPIQETREGRVLGLKSEFEVKLRELKLEFFRGMKREGESGAEIQAFLDLSGA